MVVYADIKFECPRCEGDGVAIVIAGAGQTAEEDPCTKCNGAGVISRGQVDITDLDDKINDIYDKCNDIFEVVTE